MIPKLIAAYVQAEGHYAKNAARAALQKAWYREHDKTLRRFEADQLAREWAEDNGGSND